MNVDVNYLAVLVASIVSMAIGFVWYMYLFGTAWTKLMGYTKEQIAKDQQKMGQTYTISFVLTLIMAYVLSHVMTFSSAYMKTDFVMAGLSSGFWMWLGFVAPVQATDVLFGSKKWKLFWINTGYQLASLVGMGLTIGLMG